MRTVDIGQFLYTNLPGVTYVLADLKAINKISAILLIFIYFI
jgi:hypothetical protein